MSIHAYIREHGGFENWEFVVLETMKYQEKYELKTRARYWTETLKASLNCQVPMRSKNGYYRDNKEFIALINSNMKSILNLSERPQKYMPKRIQTRLKLTGHNTMTKMLKVLLQV